MSARDAFHDTAARIGNVVVRADADRREFSCGGAMVERLIADGVVREEGGVLHVASAEALEDGIRRHPELSVCDFCFDTPVVWRFPARDFDVVGQRSFSDWLACATCRDLVRSGRRDALVRRCADSYTERFLPSAGPSDRRRIGQTLEVVQSAFWANREGPGEPAGKVT